MFSVTVVDNVFAGPPDSGERLIAAMQYCAFVPDDPSFSNDVIITLLEKGVLYKNMDGLGEFTLVELCFYILRTFSEFGERLEIVDAQLSISDSSVDKMLLSMLSRVKTNFESRQLRSSMLYVYQIVRIGDMLLIFDNNANPSIANSGCKVILISESVHLISMAWTEVQRFVTAVQPLIPDGVTAADILCVIKERDGLVDRRESYEEQVISFHDYLKESKHAEEKGNVVDLRPSIHGLYYGANDHTPASKVSHDESNKTHQSHHTPQSLFDDDEDNNKEEEEEAEKKERSEDEMDLNQGMAIPASTLHDELHHSHNNHSKSNTPPHHPPPSISHHHPNDHHEEQQQPAIRETMSALDGSTSIFRFMTKRSQREGKDEDEDVVNNQSLTDHPYSVGEGYEGHLGLVDEQDIEEEVESEEEEEEEEEEVVVANAVDEEILHLHPPKAEEIHDDHGGCHHDNHNHDNHHRPSTGTMDNTKHAQDPPDEVEFSLQRELMASHASDGSNLLAYAQRAYNIIRDHAVEDAHFDDLGQSMAFSTRPGTAVNAEKEVVHGEAAKKEYLDVGDELRRLEETLNRLGRLDDHHPKMEEDKEKVEVEEENEQKEIEVRQEEVKISNEHFPGLVATHPSPLRQSNSTHHEPRGQMERSIHLDHQDDSWMPHHHHHQGVEEDKHPKHQSYHYRSELDSDNSIPLVALPTLSREDVPLDIASLKASGAVGLGSSIKYKIILEKMRMIFDDYRHIEQQEQIKKSVHRVRIGHKVMNILRQEEEEREKNLMLELHQQEAQSRGVKTDGSKIAKIVRNHIAPPVPPPAPAAAAPPVPPRTSLLNISTAIGRSSSHRGVSPARARGASPARGSISHAMSPLPQVPSPPPPHSHQAAKASPPPGQQPPPVVSKKPALVWNIDGDEEVVQKSKLRPRSVPKLRQPRVALPVPASPPAEMTPSHENQPSAQPPLIPPPQKPRSSSAGIAGRRPGITATANAAGSVPIANGPEKGRSWLSNVQQIRNALSNVCLAGGHQEQRRLEVLDLIEYYALGRTGATLPVLQNEVNVQEALRGSVTQFVLMFYKTKSLAFKGIYVVDQRSRELVRIYGKGPSKLTPGEDGIGVSAGIKEYLKYETSSKSFKNLPVKSISSTVDGIILEAPKMRSVI